MKKFVLFFLLLSIGSCAEKVMEKPENLIPKEKMVLILHDLAILNAAKSSFKSMLEKNEIETMEFLYEKYGIDSVQFSQSDLYYASVPLEYQAIYEEVDALLEKKKKVLEDFTKQRNDSIRKINQKTKDSLQAKDSVLQKTTSDS
ncbi:DUF4296 domain-containing protein [Muricauda sp. JGD-17]|uniref:DUF4296 domain-containing protein n=1 Tax=Flagellimonas ochracea TaxID=2696472 RepID=A0A964TBY5_9FLAO|nr:DUF4296 domain-containing protein [Allomuricauda ochracea]NAY92030.1 DUF4296 domain-containing protein [Allomuricauda ochracea]